MNHLKRLIYDADRRKDTIQFMIFIFFIGCIVGWVYEEIFYFVTENWIGNRGYLYGPYLPVYGFGAVLMALFLHPFRSKPVFVFIMAMIITGILEYITGVVLWAVYHRMWWDYTNEFMNIDGLVCLRSVVSFAIGGLILMYIIEPLETKVVSKLTNKQATIICFSGIAIIIVDFIITLLTRY